MCARGSAALIRRSTEAAIYEKKLRGFEGTWCSLADCDSRFPRQMTPVKPSTDLRFTTEHPDVIKQQANIHINPFAQLTVNVNYQD